MKISTVGERANEHEMAEAVFNCCHAAPYGERTFDQLRFELPSYIELKPGDREIARVRDGEQKWVGVLRNVSRTLRNKKVVNAFGGKLTMRDGGIFCDVEIAKARAERKAEQDRKFAERDLSA